MILTRRGGVSGLRGLAVALACLIALGLGTSRSDAAPTMVVEAKTGRILHAIDAYEPWYPASLTKLMTIYVAFAEVEAGALTFESEVPISAAAAREPPSKMGFKPGEVVTLGDALRMLAVRSANDVSVAVAERVGGSQVRFADMMNDYSEKLGMTGSHWVNPHGLPDDRQVTNARDMAILARALIEDFPQHAGLFNIQRMQHGETVYTNHNTLIGRFDGADGMKTGYICSAGFNLVATATRHGRKLVAVVLGANNARERAEIAASILDKGFRSAWFALRSQNVDTIRRPPDTRPLPVDLRPVICGNEDREDSVLAGLIEAEVDLERGRRALRPGGRGNSALPDMSIAPVIVTSFSSSEQRSQVADMPLPRPRPEEEGAATAASAFR